VLQNGTLDTPRDNAGHGSHTLSTLGGNFVSGANFVGLGNGTAKGGSPKARVAAYKVCWPPIDDNECFDADIMAAFDMAIHDGVDVLSISLGSRAVDYFDDALSIAAFHAVKKGITVLCSAGNSGPTFGTVSNVAPWILTVAASTLDREFDTVVQLHNGQHFKVLSNFSSSCDIPLIKSSFSFFPSLSFSSLIFPLLIDYQGASLSTALPENKLYPLITAAEAKLAEAPVENA
jgi:hypothetical protein